MDDTVTENRAPQVNLRCAMDDEWDKLMDDII